MYWCFDQNLKALTHKQTSKQEVKVWNFNDEKGWDKFRKLTRVPTSFKNYVGKNGRITPRSTIRGGGEDLIQFCISVSRK